MDPRLQVTTDDGKNLSNMQQYSIGPFRVDNEQKTITLGKGHYSLSKEIVFGLTSETLIEGVRFTSKGVDMLIAYPARVSGRDVVDVRSVIIATAQDKETAILIAELLNKAREPKSNDAENELKG